MIENRSISLFKQLQNSVNIEKQFELIIEKCKKEKKKYVDPDFYPSIFVNENDRPYLEMAEWKRVEEFYNTNLFEDINPEIIGQGILGDCYFVSALIYLSQFPNLVKAMFHPKSDLSHGVVCIYFYILGEKLPVIVDTQLPFDSDSPIFTHPRIEGKNPAWFSLIEKAFAKACNGYVPIESGQSHVAMHYFTGWYGDAITDIKEMNKLGDVFLSLLDMKSRNAMLGSSVSMSRFSIHNTPEDVKEEIGLITDHAYQILDVKEASGNQFIKLRNPWGRFEWTGDYSDSSNKWTPLLKKQLGYTNSDDGSFWMLYKDFIKYFKDLSYSLPPEKNWNQKAFCGKIDGYLDKRSACGGSKNAGCLPQWLIKFTKPTEIRIHVEISGPQTFHGLNLVYNKGERVQVINTDIISERESTNSSVNGLQYFIEDFEHPWTVFLDRSEGADQPSYFRIVVESADNFTITKFNDDYSKMYSSSDLGVFKPGIDDGWNPFGDKAISGCRQWYFKFTKPSMIHIKIFKSLSESKHHVLFGYNDEKMSMAYTSIEPKHFNLNEMTDYEEIHLKIDKIAKSCVMCIYRDKGKDETKFKFIAYSENRFEFGEILEKECDPIKYDFDFSEFDTIPQPANFVAYRNGPTTVNTELYQNGNENNVERVGLVVNGQIVEGGTQQKSKCCLIL
ncbi:hypothetical protein TRFO_22760 [Tritrichomonas foetus]|uniref:Calpain catalytic domain-containing protein n=1 Tax=Tritrichomonas foetus TaxID=1144522 RepID=A0A1J4KG97_9EUKA|nr:hypothetical protein TRFO_22760 [Tritrichomonas foetus]|eukprot:OHT08670.1 hypothetical protein TRFO_22760 [Tritrichomonas foetus]